MAALPSQDWGGWPVKGTLTEGLNAFLQQLIFTAAALIQHAQSHGSHDLADFPGAGARLVAPGLSGPAPPPCLSWAFLVRLSVGTPPQGIMGTPSFGQTPRILLEPKTPRHHGGKPLENSKSWEPSPTGKLKGLLLPLQGIRGKDSQDHPEPPGNHGEEDPRITKEPPGNHKNPFLQALTLNSP